MKFKILYTLLLVFIFPTIVHAVDLTIKDRGSTISLPVGETITITLAGNPTTGYRWELADVEQTLLLPDPEPTYIPDSSLAGSGGKFTFRLFALKAGTTDLKLLYRRSWEKDIPPVQRFDLKVNVIPETRLTVVNYRSADGKTATASFDPARAEVTVTLTGRPSVVLPAAISASGARYSNGSETFWEHQGIGRFFKGETLLFEGAILQSSKAAPSGTVKE